MAFTHVALVRGINVGGKNMLPMKALADLFAAAGCADVKTHIQSGNVLFNADSDLASTLASKLSSEIAERHGISTRIVLREAGELSDAIAANPFSDDVEKGLIYVMFLAAPPDPSLISLLDPQRSPPDEFAVLGREIFLRLPNGAANTKLTIDYFESLLKTFGTARNWRTLVGLNAMMRG